MASKNKTEFSTVDPRDFVAAVDHPTRRADAVVLLDLMTRLSGCPAQMWGPSIVGFGRYHYRYDSGHEGEAPITGFSPRRANLVLYVMPGYEDHEDQLARLGKHKIGKSCLYINKLADIDLAVLEEMIVEGLATMRRDHETWDR